MSVVFIHKKHDQRMVIPSPLSSTNQMDLRVYNPWVERIVLCYARGNPSALYSCQQTKNA